MTFFFLTKVTILYFFPTDFTTQEYATMKNWARSMFGLWVTQPNSFEMEQAYNASMADQKPGCCVCTLFYNEKVDMGYSAAPSQSAWDEEGKVCDNRR